MCLTKGTKAFLDTLYIISKTYRLNTCTEFVVMSDNLSPVKCAPPSDKKGRSSIIWYRCIIWQVNTAESLTIPTENGISTLLRSWINVNTKFTEGLSVNSHHSRMPPFRTLCTTKPVIDLLRESRICRQYLFL